MMPPMTVLVMAGCWQGEDQWPTGALLLLLLLLVMRSPPGTLVTVATPAQVTVWSRSAALQHCSHRPCSLTLGPCSADFIMGHNPGL